MTERGFRMNVNPVDDYVGDDIRNYITRKDCFDFCSEAFGEMRHSTEEEKKLYENMLAKLSKDVSMFDRVALGEWVYNPTCKDCKHFIGGGDWNLCCAINYWLCYEDTETCEKFEWKQ